MFRSNLLDRFWGWGYYVLGVYMRMLRIVVYIRGVVGGRFYYYVFYGRWYVGFMMKGGDFLILWGYFMVVWRVILGGYVMKIRWGLVLYGYWGYRLGILGWRYIGGYVYGRVLGLVYKLVFVYKVFIWIVVIYG